MQASSLPSTGALLSFLEADFGLVALAACRELWESHGSILRQVPQGHFGYAALRETMKQVESRIVG